MIDVIAAEEMLGNALAWVCLRGAGVLLAALALLWFCKVVGAPITVLWRRLTPVGRTAACAMLLVGIIYGGSKTNGPPLRVIAPVAVSPEDIARGYRVECVTTNADPFAEMPSGAGRPRRAFHSVSAVSFGDTKTLPAPMQSRIVASSTNAISSNVLTFIISNYS